MDKLDPCPFCGETPVWNIVGENNDLLRFGCSWEKSCCVTWIIPFTKPYYENALQEATRRWNRRAIVSAPTVDAVPVVRCKDCFKRNTTMCGMKHERADMDFCSTGERKDDTQ